MRLTRLSLLFLLALPALAGRAQKTTTSEGFQQMRQQLLDEFDSFRQEANKEYAYFLSQAWEEFTLFQGKPFFEEPKLPEPEVTSLDSLPITHSRMEVQESDDAEATFDLPAEIKSQLESAELSGEKPFNIPFYGASLALRYQASSGTLASIKEADVARLWTIFAETKFSTLLLDMVAHREKRQMNDWAYYLFAKQIAQNLSALKDENTRMIFQCFLLIQSGYDVRLTRVDNFLALLVPFNEAVYNCPFLKIDGKTYYLFANKKLADYSTLFSYRLPIGDKRGCALSLRMKQPLLLPRQPKPFTINGAGMQVKGEINLHQIQFYRDYPQCHLLVHAQATPDREFQQSLIGSLRKQLLAGDTLALLNKLLLWVQTGFKYQTDERQFGAEKPFFIEENFYYPYNDCEDRSVLFCYLVRQLLGREAVLLNYPGHMATAIQTTHASTPGEHVSIGRKRYIICDPTFVNARPGRSMLKYKGVKPKVLSIK